MDLMEYADVYAAIVAEAERILGAVARRQASGVEGITVTEDGAVEADHELGTADIAALVDAYRDIAGDGAVGIARRAISDLGEQDREGLKSLDLPVDILPSDMKADLFAESF